MITQTEVNKCFNMGEQRMFDVCSLIEETMLGHAEIAGMLMGALKVHSLRRGTDLFATAVELAELIESMYEDD